MTSSPESPGDPEASRFAAFQRFIEFFCELFAQPGLLADAQCRDSYKTYVVDYYRNLFAAGVKTDSARHIKWYRKLSPLFSLSKGARILDYGGGYGMDAIFLASLGYHVTFYEITPHHIGIARWFADRYRRQCAALQIDFVLAGKDSVPSQLDAVFANEVAHHVEPPQRLFEFAAEIVHGGGQLFILEPNFMSPAVQAFFLRARGLRTTVWQVDEATGQPYLWGNEHIRPVSSWNTIASRAGFRLIDARYFVPWTSARWAIQAPPERLRVERWPLVKNVLASHVTLQYEKL